MKKNQVERRPYTEPQIQVIGIDPYSCLLEASNGGGHNKVGDDGELNAKETWFDDDEELN